MKRKIYLTAFLFSFSIAITAYINSTYVSGLIGEKKVGLLYGLASIVTLLGLYIVPFIINKIGNKRLLVLSLLSSISALSFLAHTTNSIIGSLAFIIYLASNTISFFALDIFLEHFSADKSTGKTRGFYLSFNNLAWMCAPILSGVLLGFGGFLLSYSFAQFVVFITLVIFMISVKGFVDVKYIREPLRLTIAKVWKLKNIRNIIISSFLLQFFFSWMVIYTPLYLKDTLGLSWSQIGKIFTFMLSAFVIMQYPIGRLIDKGWKEKYILGFGFVVIGISTLFFGSGIVGDLSLIAITLFITRVGASMIESSSEIYFFKHTTDKDTNVLSLLRNMAPFAYVVGPLSASILLIFFPIMTLFNFLAIVMFCGVFLIKKL